MRLLPPRVSTLATTVLVLTFGSAFFGWETSLLTPLSLLTVSLIMLQAQHVQQAEPARPIPGPPIPVLSAIGLGLAIALLGYGLYNHDAVAAVNLPAAGILLYVVVNAYRQRQPAPQPVFITTPTAPLSETSTSHPQ